MKKLGLILLVACGGGGSTTKDGAIDAPHAIDAKVTFDGAPVDGLPVDSTVDGSLVDGSLMDGSLVDGSLVDAATSDAAVMMDASTNPTLKVKNYFSWCSVTVNGNTASTLPEQNVVVTPGTINVSAVALGPTFILGPAPWHDTAGDTGTGDPGTVTGSGGTASNATTVVVGATNKCIWVCCPFANGTGCPTTDQCP